MKTPIWQPSEERKINTNMTGFMDFVSKRYGKGLHSYHELYDWSVASPADFWASAWDYVEIKASEPCDTVIVPAEHMMYTGWFQRATQLRGEPAPVP